MPRRTSRQKRALYLIKFYLRFRKIRERQLKRHARFRRHISRDADEPGPLPILDTFFDDLSISDNSMSDGSGSWSSLFGSDWHGSTMSGSPSSTPESSASSTTSDDIVLGPVRPEDDIWGNMEELDSDSDIKSSEAESDDSGFVPDDEDWIFNDNEEEIRWSDEEDLHDNQRPPSTIRLGRFVRHALSEMYAQHYEAPRNQFPHPPATLPFLLDRTKQLRPDLFRRELRVSPATFDALVRSLADDPVFINNSQNQQMPVEHQVAIILYRFGHDGNAASLDSIATWAGYGKGTILLATRRVMAAILRPNFVHDVISFPTEEEKEAAKCWIEKRSCKAWRDGWCMVDGTLVPLYNRPFWYGQSYFDRKCNYSLNIQVTSKTYATSLKI